MVAPVLNFTEFVLQVSLSVALERRNCRTICRKVPLFWRTRDHILLSDYTRFRRTSTGFPLDACLRISK